MSGKSERGQLGRICDLLGSLDAIDVTLPERTATAAV
jgi:hypothetical protein